MLKMNAFHAQFYALHQAHMCYASAMAAAAAGNIGINTQTHANLEAWRANLQRQTKLYSTHIAGMAPTEDMAPPPDLAPGGEARDEAETTPPQVEPSPPPAGASSRPVLGEVTNTARDRRAGVDGQSQREPRKRKRGRKSREECKEHNGIMKHFLMQYFTDSECPSLLAFCR